MTSPMGVRLKCTNHPDADATATCRMHAPEKQPDGEYLQDVPLCAPCAEHMEKLAPHWPQTRVTSPTEPAESDSRDIIDRLRVPTIADSGAIGLRLATEAADEIERLREVLRVLVDEASWNPPVALLRPLAMARAALPASDGKEATT